MMNLILSLFIAISTMADTKVKVEATSPDYPLDQLDPQIYDVKPSRPKSTIKPPLERDKILFNADLKKETAKMDNLDRDLLMIRAKNYKIEDLKKIYPNILESKLHALQKLLN